MADNNGFRKERVKNALDNRKLNMSAPTPGHQGKKANLIWGLYSNNPRLTVYTGDPNEQGDASKGYGKISANLDAPTFFAFLNLLQTAVKKETENGWKDKIENKNFIFPGGKRSEEPVVVSELWVGKDNDGVIWISVVDRKDRPKIKFEFGANDFHRFVHGDGRAYTKAETSTIYAMGYITILQSMMSHLMCTLWVEPEQKPAGGGGGGGYNRNNGGGGNRNSGGGNSGGGSEFGDDIPF